jgi:hypothetical protein
METEQKEENKKSNMPTGMPAGIPTGMPIGNLKIPKQLSDVKDQAKNMAENFIKDKAKMIAKQAAKKIATTLLTNPYVLAAIGIGLAILILFLIIIAIITGQGAVPSGANAQPGAPPTTNNSILSWAQQIDDNVTKLACSIYRNTMQATVTNGKYTVPQKKGTCNGEGGSAFLCTDLVIQSYKLAGISKYFSRKSYTMARNWVPSVQLIAGQNVFSLISPGDAFFPSCNNTTSQIGHASLIFNVSINSNGAGTITTIDTNMPSEYNTYRVRNWNITSIASITCGVTNKSGIAHYFWLGQQ